MSMCYQWAVIVASIGAFAAIVVEIADERQSFLTFKDNTARLGLLSNLPLAAGAVASNMLLGVLRRQHVYEDTLRLLKAYSNLKGFNEIWEIHACRDKVVVFLAWATTVALSSAGMMLQQPQDGQQVEIGQIVHMVAVAILSGVLLWMTFCVLYFCRSLVVMVDMFSCDSVTIMDLGETANTWNVLQAILRKASATMELCFLSLVAVAVFTVPAMILDFASLGMERKGVLLLGPCIVVICSILWMFSMAALITDKCTRVPALINSLNFGPGTERSRQHTIDYIVSSAAGFYVCDARLTTTMVFKFMYGWSVVAIGLSTKFFTDQ